MGEFFKDPETAPQPVNTQPPLDAAEIERDISDMVDRFQGRQLKAELTRYFVLSLIEVVLVSDQSPTRVERLADDKIETLRRLTPGLDE